MRRRVPVADAPGRRHAPPATFRPWEWEGEDRIDRFADDDGNVTPPVLRALHRWLDAREDWRAAQRRAT